MFNKKDWIFMAVFGVVFYIGAKILESYQTGIEWRIALSIVYFIMFLIAERFVYASEESEPSKEGKS